MTRYLQQFPNCGVVSTHNYMFFLTTYLSPSRVSHGTIDTWRSLVWSDKEEETRLIDFDMCDQHEAIV